jgi:hypothetical protein
MIRDTFTVAGDRLNIYVALGVNLDIIDYNYIHKQDKRRMFYLLVHNINTNGLP